MNKLRLRSSVVLFGYIVDNINSFDLAKRVCSSEELSRFVDDISEKYVDDWTINDVEFIRGLAESIDDHVSGIRGIIGNDSLREYGYTFAEYIKRQEEEYNNELYSK